MILFILIIMNLKGYKPNPKKGDWETF